MPFAPSNAANGRAHRTGKAVKSSLRRAVKGKTTALTR